MLFGHLTFGNWRRLVDLLVSTSFTRILRCRLSIYWKVSYKNVSCQTHASPFFESLLSHSFHHNLNMYVYTVARQSVFNEVLPQGNMHGLEWRVLLPLPSAVLSAAWSVLNIMHTAKDHIPSPIWILPKYFVQHFVVGQLVLLQCCWCRWINCSHSHACAAVWAEFGECDDPY